MYGLGIRLGIYMQWLSALLVCGWYIDGLEGLNESYIIFLFAVTIVIIVQTAQTAPTYAVEIVILTYIIFGGAWAVVAGGIRTRPLLKLEARRVARLQFLSMVLVLGACALYCSWFWARGIHRPGSFLDTPCGAYMFLFAKIPLYNRHLITFFTVVSIYATVVWIGIPVVTGVIVAASNRGMDVSRTPEGMMEIANMLWRDGFSESERDVLLE